MPQEEAQVTESAVVDDTGAMSFEDAMKAAFETVDPAPMEVPFEDAPESDENVPQGEVEVPEGESTQEKPDPVTAAPEKPEEVVTPEPEPDKAMAKLMAKEEALLAREQKYEAAKADLDNLRTKLDSYEASQASFERDPISFIKTLAPDIDLKRLAEMAWYENQGEKAPQEYLKSKAASRQNNELADRIAKVEQGLTARERAIQEQESLRAEQQYIGSLQAYAASAKEDTHPLMAAMRGKNEALVNQGLENIARARAIQSQGKEILTPEQCADLLEKELAMYQVGAPPVKEAPKEPQQAGSSLRNSSQQVQPDRESEDPLDDAVLRRQACKAAGIPYFE